jgi:glycosyltransferase involved in cell wall biosynthesis
VIPASWIDDERVLSAEAMEQLWAGKAQCAARELRIGFFGRLTPAKGVAVLLRAMSILQASGRRVRLDVFGDGELRSECERAAGAQGSVEMVYHGTIAYDEKFFEAVRPLHAVVVPTLSDEQPRIVYDAYSQAVPVIASDTPGLRACAGRECRGLCSTG